MILELLLGQAGFQTVSCVNGFEAFQKVQDSLADESCASLFDVIVLDLNMPICGGKEACSKIVELYKGSSLFQEKSFFTLKGSQIIKQPLLNTPRLGESVL